MFDPREQVDDESYRLMAALDGARAPSGFTGGCGSLLCGGLLVILLGAPPSIGVMASVLGFVLIAAIGPALLLASALLGPGGPGDVAGYVRQARLLTAFWWVFAITGVSILLTNAVLIAIGFAFGR